jgi:hypothetical protein
MPVAKQSFTSQEQMAEHMIHHLLTQNKKSTEDGESCLYRYVDVDGSIYSCAVGCLINDDYYDESLERKGAGDPDVLQVLSMSHPDADITPEFVKYMNTLQGIHDNLSTEGWRRLFIDENGNVIVPEISSWDDLFNSYQELMNMEWDG